MNKMLLELVRSKFVAKLPWVKLSAALKGRHVSINVDGKVVKGTLTDASAFGIQAEVKRWIEARL